jgi:hypothetical protein
MRAVLLQGHPVAAVAAIAGATIGLAVVLQVSGARPYGEQAILQQIAQEDTALCGKFGFEAGTPKHTSCLLDLADLRTSHVDLLKSRSWL